MSVGSTASGPRRKNPKTGRNPQKRAKAWHAALLGTKHYIFARLSRNFFLCVCEGEIHSFLRYILPKQAVFVEQRREVFKVFFFIFIQ